MPHTEVSLRILFLVDDDQFLVDWSTDALQNAFVDGKFPIDVTVKLRSPAFRLTTDELRKYDEVWFFLHNPDGKDADRLDEPERTALLRWMNGGGGVLVAGDHAEGKEGNYRGLGAPIGRCIPRARHMRVWDGPPGILDKDRAADTTDFSIAGRGVDPTYLAQDSLPQRLLLPLVVSGIPSSAEARPHAVFRAGVDRILDRFPDHEHEGWVKKTAGAATESEHAKWPEIPQEWPHLSVPPKRGSDIPGVDIIALGVDWRHGRTHNLMAQWDGHQLPLPGTDEAYGRILADASFHHYVDFNLASIVNKADENWRVIGELFRNMAAWLAPRSYKVKRCDMALDWVRKHEAYVQAVEGNSKASGRVARRLLAEALPGAWFHENVDELIRELDLGVVLPFTRGELEAVVLGVQVRGPVGMSFTDAVLANLGLLSSISPEDLKAIREVVRGSPTGPAATEDPQDSGELET
jgi:hypothetical protein